MRFLAALPVVLIHAGGQFFTWPALKAVIGYGYLGVTFFFLLSGFVLTWSYTQQPARRFWWLRFSRIWPAQLLVALFAFVLLASHEKVPDWPGRVADVLLVQSWWPDSTVYYGGNGVSWSLSCEAFFYLMFPALAAGLVRLNWRGLGLTSAACLAVLGIAPFVATAAGVSGRLYGWLFFILPAYRLCEFVLGMVLARCVRLGFRMPRPGLAMALGGGAMVALAAGMAWHTVGAGRTMDRPVAALLMIPVFGLLLVAGATKDIHGSVGALASRPLVWLGMTSFALYLVHQPLLRLTQSWGWWPRTQGLPGLLAFTAFLILAVGVAGALHHLFERPVEGTLRQLPVGKGAARWWPAGAVLNRAAGARLQVWLRRRMVSAAARLERS
jgi:peptidoglycan/LPS O-acetylase OafA/YrhL